MFFVVTGFCAFCKLSFCGIRSSRVHYYLENKNSNYKPFIVTVIHSGFNPNQKLNRNNFTRIISFF